MWRKSCLYKSFSSWLILILWKFIWITSDFPNLKHVLLIMYQSIMSYITYHGFHGQITAFYLTYNNLCTQLFQFVHMAFVIQTFNGISPPTTHNRLRCPPRKPYWLKANFKSKRDRDLRFVANWPPRKNNVTSPGGKLETMQILSYRVEYLGGTRVVYLMLKQYYLFLILYCALLLWQRAGRLSVWLVII